MANPPTGSTEQLTKSSLDISRIGSTGHAILRCVDTSVLRDKSGREIKLDGNEISIGRGDNNSVRLNGIGVSRSHARITYENNIWQVEDLGSTNGTRVNNSNITRAALVDGDTVAFGRVCYKFIMLDAHRSSRVLDLGADQTLVLHPQRQHPGDDSQAPTPTAMPTAPTTASAPARERDLGTTQRRTAVKRPPEQSSDLVMWITVIAVGLAIVLAAILVLT